MGQLYPGSIYNTNGGTTVPRTSYIMSPATDGTTTAFTVQGIVSSASPNYIDVYLNGLLQQFNVDYTLNSSGIAYVVTFTTPPLAGDVPEAVY